MIYYAESEVSSPDFFFSPWENHDRDPLVLTGETYYCVTLLENDRYKVLLRRRRRRAVNDMTT